MRQLLSLARLLFLLAVLTTTVPACRAATSAAHPGQSVVLIHGMGRSRAAMLILEKRLGAAGYHTVNFGYDAGDETLDAISKRLLATIEREVVGRPEVARYHLVGHSLGNIIARNAFRFGYPKDSDTALATVVMLAPPNKPALLAQQLASNSLYRWFNGEAGQKLADPSFYQTLAVPTVPFGIIAGTQGQRLTFDQPNDGIVAVANTKLDGMRDWIELDHTHTFIMNAADTFEQVVHFMEQQRFRR